MKKTYSTALLKAAKIKLPQALDGYQLEKEFGVKYHGKSCVSLRKGSDDCSRYVVIYFDRREPTSFLVDLCWIRSPGASMMAVLDKAVERDESGALIPRAEVAFGSVSLQEVCGYQHCLGYRIPSAFDKVQLRSEEALAGMSLPESVKFITSSKYERLLAQWLAEADMEDAQRKPSEIQRAVDEALDAAIKDLVNAGIGFLDKACR